MVTESSGIIIREITYHGTLRDIVKSLKVKIKQTVIKKLQTETVI